LSADGYRRESRRIENVGDWLAWRRTHITASRMGALVNAHPYLSPEQLAGELRGQSTNGDTPAMRRGRVLEAAVIEALREEHPEWRIERARDYHFLPEHRLGATPDAFFADEEADDGLIECKTVRPEIWERWHGRRHEAAERRVLDATAAWWRAFDAGEIAAPTPAAELEGMLDDGTYLDWSANDEVRRLLEERRVLKIDVSIATQKLGACEYALKNRLGSASSAWLPGWSLSFRRTHRKEYTVAGADIRVLRIKEISHE
jgi:hypothetical protein